MSFLAHNVVYFHDLFHGQPRSTWCVTRCVQTQGAGVQDPTSASPASTSSVGESAWTGAIYMRGESR